MAGGSFTPGTETISERFARVGAGRDYEAALDFLRTPARYIDLGRACEANGLAGFGADGEAWFQPPSDLAAEQAAEPLLRALREIVAECRNGGYPNEIVATRMIERIEETAMAAISKAEGR